MSSSNGYIEHSAKMLSSGTVLFRAPSSEIRQERTGVHARVGIFLEVDGKQTLLEVHTFNIGRMEERTKLANAAHAALDGISADEYKKNQMRHDLSIYCAGLWNEHIKTAMAQPLAGDAIGNPQVFLARPFLTRGGGTLMFAPPGRGKSYTALLMAVSVDAGNSHLFDVTQSKVLFVNLERSEESFARRLGCVNTALGEDPGRPLLMINQRGKSLRDIRDIVAQSMEKYNCTSLFLDSLSRAGQGNLTENQPVNAIMDTLNALSPTWFAIAHTPREDESHVYGSIYHDAAADVMLRMLSEEAELSLGIGLKVTKANDIAKPPVQTFKYVFDEEYGLSSANKASTRDFPGLRAETMSPADEMLAYLRHEAGRADAEELARVIGKSRNYVSQILNSDSRFMRLSKDGRKLLWSAKGDREG